jgi:signal transduction histidine kinase
MLITRYFNLVRSLRGRVVSWYLALLATLLLGLCVVQTVTLTGYLRSAKVVTMQQSANAALGLVGPCFIRSTSDLRLHARSAAVLLGSSDFATSVITPGGRVLARYQPTAGTARGSLVASPAIVRTLLASIPVRQPALGARAGCKAAGTPSTAAPVSVRSGNTLFVAMALGPPARPAGYAILSRSMAVEDGTLQQVRLTLILGALAVLLIAALVGIPIVNRALRPLHRVTATAEAIAAGDLEQRAKLAPSADEVGRLGKAFDTMVDRLQAALSASTESEERMRRFLADASHELRTPLTVLRGTAQLLQRHDTLDALETATTFRAIQEEAERMSRLVDDLLTLSKVDAGVPLDPHPVTIRRFLEDFVQQYASAWPTRTLEMHTSNLNGTQASVDSEALRRVITNLVENSARYSTAGEPITIEGEAGVDTVFIRVKDVGPGFVEEDANHAFERFYRGNKSRARANGGSGLGLSIVHALVQQSHGEIQIDTGPDRGTTVAITLPRLDEPVHAHQEEPRTARPLELIRRGP